jgi:hypothetical protein
MSFLRGAATMRHIEFIVQIKVLGLRLVFKMVIALVQVLP